MMEGLTEHPSPSLTAGSVIPFASVALFLFLNAAFVAYSYAAWEERFKARVERSNPLSPSNGTRPHTRSRSDKLRQIKKSTSRASLVFMVDSYDKDASVQKHLKEDEDLKTRSRRRETIAVKIGATLQYGLSGILFKPWEEAKKQNAGKLRLSNGTVGTWDMDHVLISFEDFLWAMYFLAPHGAMQWVYGIAKLKALDAMRSRGVLSRQKADNPSRLVAQLMLESFQSMHYVFTRGAEDGARIATFSYARFPYLLHGKYQVAKLFTICVDLDTKEMVKATLDDERVSAREAMLLVYFNAATADHVKMHSLSNWAINVEDGSNDFLHRMSVVSVMYNYFGFTLFPRICQTWKLLSFTEHDYSDMSQVFMHGVREGIHSHAHIHELAKDSELVNFVIKVRNKFLNCFVAHRESFPGIDGEAFFVGTCLHSLDHYLLEKLLPDPFSISPQHFDPKFEAMAEISQFIRVGFVPEPVGHLFKKRMKHAPGPFYKAVYDHAAKVNKELADHMDACIAK